MSSATTTTTITTGNSASSKSRSSSSSSSKTRSTTSTKASSVHDFGGVQTKRKPLTSRNKTMDPPSKADVDAAGDLDVLRADGTSVPFKSFHSGEGVTRRVLVIFIRHFFCGNCQEYLQTLNQHFTPDMLLSLPIPTSIVIIGCGGPELISEYADVTGCRFPVYADPSRKVFDAFGMGRSFSLGPKAPEYMRRSVLVNALQSIVQVIKTGPTARKGGDFKQNGGELLFKDGALVWSHRMQNTRDHTEMGVLKGLLGLAEDDGPAESQTETTTVEK